MVESRFGSLQKARFVLTILLAAIGLVALGSAPILLAALGGVAFATAIGLQPWLAAPFVVLTLPYYLHPRTFGNVELSVTEAAILLATLGALVRAAVEASFTPQPDVGKERRIRLPQASAVDWVAAAMLAAALLSLPMTEYPKQSLRELRWLIVEPLLIFYVARATIATPAHVRATLWSLVVSGTAAALVAFASLVLQGDLTSSLARATAPYLSPNHLGLFLGRAGAVALAIALFAHDPVRWSSGRGLALIALAVIGLGALRTLSLGAWAGLGAATLSLTALRSRRWLAIAAVGLGLLFFAAIVALPAGRTTGRLDPTTGTAQFRREIWTASLHMVADHPLLGIGLDNFLYQYRGGYMLPEAAAEPNISHPHNWLLNFWLELGLLGLVAALGLLAWVAAIAWRLVRTPGSSTDRLVGAAAIGVFVDTLVHGSLDNSYFLVDAAALWWLFAALLALHSPRGRDGSQAGEQSSRIAD